MSDGEHAQSDTSAVEDLSDPAVLVGGWSFNRIIEDHLAGTRYTATGVATIQPWAEHRLRWTERGLMTWGANSVPVHRTLFLEQRGPRWTVTFEDGRDFHPWAPGAIVDYACGHDMYVGCIAPGTGAIDLTVTWRTTGPTKDYSATTELRRTS